MQLNHAIDAKRRALLGMGLASVMVAAGCGGGGGGAGPGTQVPTDDPVTPPPASNLKSWQAAEELLRAEADGIVYSEPQIAFDGGKGGMAVWVRVQNGRGQLWASRLSQAGTWQPPEPVDSALAGFAAMPRLVMDAAGNALAAWECTEAGRTTIAVNRFDGDEGKWMDAFELPSNVQVSLIDALTPAVTPDIAMDAAGNAVVVWSQAADAISRTRILSKTYKAATKQWDADDKLIFEQVAIESSVNPFVVMSPEGDALAVWQVRRADQSGNDLMSSRLLAGAPAWSPVMNVHANIGLGSQEGHQLAIAPSGDAMVVWQFRVDENNTGLFARRLPAGAADWEVTQQIVGVTGQLPGLPRLAMTATADAMVVWDEAVDPAGKVRPILASRFTALDGQPKAWTAPLSLERVRGGVSVKPRIATMDAEGNALVVWEHNLPDQRSNVLGANYRADVKEWTTTGRFLEQENATGNSTNPIVAMRADGTAVAIWQQLVRNPVTAQPEGVLWTAEFK